VTRHRAFFAPGTEAIVDIFPHGRKIAGKKHLFASDVVIRLCVMDITEGAGSPA